VAIRVRLKPCTISLPTLRAPQSDAPQSLPLKPRKRKSVPSLPVPLENFSAQRATWLFVCEPEKLDQIQQEELMRIRQASPSAETAYGLAQAFMHMIREHTASQLETWLSSVEASHVPELKSIARGIRQDKAAVVAGLTLPWNNGPMEGHVNRLKLIKRSMYGRAKLPLLRARVLACWPRRSLLARLSLLDSDVPARPHGERMQEGRAGAGTGRA